MSAAFDLVIVGAGPAGLAAAATGSSLGLKIAVIDEQAEPGGQIYRGIESVSARRPAHLQLLGDDYAAGRTLVKRFRASSAEYLPLTTVWQIDGECNVFTRGSAGAMPWSLAIEFVLACLRP